MSSAPISCIVYEDAGLPVRLTSEHDWREAVRLGKIGPNTLIGIFWSNGARRDVPAGEVDMFRSVFDQMGAPRVALDKGAPPPSSHHNAYPPAGAAPAFGPMQGRPYAAPAQAWPPSGQGPGRSWGPPAPRGGSGGNPIVIALLALVLILLVVVVVVLLMRSPSGGSNTSGATGGADPVEMAEGQTGDAAFNSAPDATRNTATAIDPTDTLTANAASNMTTNTVSVQGPAVSSASLESRARSVVDSYYTSWSPSNDVSWIGYAYTGEPNYYGARLQRSRIMEKQRDLISRWPSRSFSIVPGSTSTSCDSSQTCTVRGRVDIHYRNNFDGDSMGGRAEFTIVTRDSNGSMVIASESGRMLSRY